jgi:transglutaminase-like putative cysteine protease
MVSPAARASLAAATLFAASVLLVIGSAPLWCVAIGLACALWRVLTVSGYLAAPKQRRGLRFAMGAVTGLLVVAVALRFRTLNGLAAGTALLVVMGALKVMESRTRRDDAIVIGVSLFLLLAAGLAVQSLLRAPLYLLALWGACATIALVAHGGSSLSTGAALRVSARALLMSLPLALLCFAFFPRLTGQLWALHGGSVATTGLDDEMSPGSISELATEYDPAFRAIFTGPPPRHSLLYWRGPVLNSFDGFTWRRERTREYRAPQVRLLGDPVHYRITMEPSNQRWLFALDTVARSPRREVALTHDRLLIAMDPVTAVTSYDAVSHLETRAQQPLSDYGRSIETRLPADRNPRARALALQLRARAGSDAEYARQVLEWFRAQGLEYTLEPGVTGIDSVDTTLFDSRRGFCGHFASAYATLMRAADVPARVVTGYLGGEWNPVGGYYLVRQSEAHAWAEIWLDERGWTRIDPTAVVAPERLERGVFELLAGSLPTTSTFVHNTPMLRRLTLLWDGMNQWWQSSVVEFDLRSQFALLNRLGIESPQWQHLGWAFAFGLLAWIAWIALALRRGVGSRRHDEISRLWLSATRKFARVALPRQPAEGPLDYATRIGAVRPDLAAIAHDIARRYAALRFGASGSDEDLAEFRRAVHALRIWSRDRRRRSGLSGQAHSP